MACCRAITLAIIGCTKVRAAFEDLALKGCTCWIVWHTATSHWRLPRLGIVIVRRPFPDIADHVVQAKAVGGKAANGRRALPSVKQQIGIGKLPLPIIGEYGSTGRKFIAPGIVRAVQPAARCIFPFGFGRKCFTCPMWHRHDIGIADMDNRMILQTTNRASRSSRMLPVRTSPKIPP